MVQASHDREDRELDIHRECFLLPLICCVYVEKLWKIL